MNDRQEARFPLDPPARGSFSGRHSVLIQNISFQGMKVLSGYAPPVGTRQMLFLRSGEDSTALPVQILDAEVCCPDEDARRHFTGGLVFSIRCGICELNDECRQSIVRLLESNYSHLDPRAG